MLFKYLCHLNLHGWSQEVMELLRETYHSLEEKTALKYKLDV